jgi:ABC-type phosphate/phosphonate transport system substrate-binding protein
MRRPTVPRIGLLPLGLLLVAACGHHAAVPRPVTVKVMVLPEYSLNEMAERVAPLVARLQTSLGPGYRVEWISCPSSEAFMATAERERPDVSLQDGYHTAWLIRLQQAEPMLCAVSPDGGTKTRGVIIAADDGPVRTIADLAGRRVAIPSRRSYAGYIAQASLLEKTANLHFGAVQFLPVRWSDRVEASMRLGRAEAGFIGEADLWPGARVLARTEPIPTACVVRFPQTPPAVAAIIRQTLADLGTRGPDDAAVLHGLGIRGFAAIDAQAREEIVRLAENSPVPY